MVLKFECIAQFIIVLYKIYFSIEMKKPKQTSVLPPIIKNKNATLSSAQSSAPSSARPLSPVTLSQSYSPVTPRSYEENSSILVKIMTSEIFRVKCRHCFTVLQSESEYEYKKCKCGKIGIDGGRSIHNRRLTGSLDDVDI
jgi:hypothetical protein